MAFSAPRVAAALTQRWAPVLSGLSDAALLLDSAERLSACTAAARELLGAAVDVPGTPARALLGLPPGTELEGEYTIAPPAAGQVLRAALRRVTLCDDTGDVTGCLLLIIPQDVPAVSSPSDSDREHRLREVALTISSSLGIDQVLERVVRLSMELFGAGAGSLPLYDARYDRLRPAHVVNLALKLANSPVIRGTGAVWDLIDTGRPFLHNDYSSDPRAIPELVDKGVSAVAAAPVVGGGQILGVLILYHMGAGQSFSQRDVELLEIIGRQAGVALLNALRFEEALRESHRRHLLYQASVAFSAALAPEQLYLTIHHTLARLVPCDTIGIALFDEASQEVNYVYLADRHGRWPGGHMPVSRGLLGFIIRTGISLRITGCDPTIEALFGAEPFGEGEDTTGSLLALALPVGGRTIGAFTVQAIAADAYSTDDLSALETLAVTVAIALQNAHLFARVNELATIDPLTGIANRRHFLEQARHEVERANRYGHPISLLMLDADHFKQINDRYGHVVGDQVLQTIARRCWADLRDIDVIGRYGGEEFLVLLPETSAAQALVVAERLRDTISSEPALTDVGPVAVNISVGVASFPPGAGGMFEALLDQVDKALYLAKAAGRNQVCAL